MSPPRDSGLSPPGSSGPGEQAPGAAGRRPRSAFTLFVVAVAALVFFSGFVALGTWQIKRRAWKLDLIARVEQRVHAPAVEAPEESQWSDVTAANSEYRHVQASGIFLNDAETLVQATTDLGAGFWVMTPLRRADGTFVLVNRGFVPPERRGRAAHGAAELTTSATVTGLLRMTEPRGAFLRHNDPPANRWYSRDVQAIAAARGLSRVAPYFMDAEAPPPADRASSADAAAASANATDTSAAAAQAPIDATGTPATATQTPIDATRAHATQTPGAAGPSADASQTPGVPSPSTAASRTPGAASPPTFSDPIPGLTVIAFHNSHLVYVITWYTLALMTLWGAWILFREEHRLRRGEGAGGGAS